MKKSSWFSVAALALAWSETALAAKIACVGDSITYGYNLSNPTTESYPARLQTLLGREHTVQNFGVSGTTVLKQSDHPYWGESAYTASGNFGPDIVIVMLGTNDAKPQNWTHQASFSTDYRDLVDHYRMLGAVVYVATPPPVYGSGAYDIQPDVVSTQVVPRVRQLATDMNAPLVDVFTALSGKSQYFPDNVHPNAAGAQLIAETVRTALNFNLGGTGGVGGTTGAGGTGAASGGGASRAGAGGALAQGGRASGGAGTAGAFGSAGQGGTTGIGTGGSDASGASHGGVGAGGASGAGSSGAAGSSSGSGGATQGGAFGSPGGTNSAGAPGVATGGAGASGGATNGPMDGRSGGRAGSGMLSQGSDASGCAFKRGRSPGSKTSVLALLGALALRGWRRERHRNLRGAKSPNAVGRERRR